MPAGDERPVLFAEPGSSWWPVSWGPAFGAAGLALGAPAGSSHWPAWLVVGLGLGVLTALWVRSRRRLLRVLLTGDTLTQGQERLDVARIAGLAEDAPAGARVLGGGWTVPRGFTEVPVRLDDGSVVIAFARDGEGLRGALRGCV